MSRNPSWTRDELILALDLYFKAGRKWLPPDHSEVVQLSNLLNRLSLHDPTIRETNFRNPQGVAMKFGNFLTVDPHVTSGLISPVLPV
jgi:5-methylcytosine-specific restriction protein A